MQPERAGTSANGDEIPIPKVHRRRMHFRRSNRLSALAVRPDWKKGRREKKREGDRQTDARKGGKRREREREGERPHNTADGKVAYWNSIPREIISGGIAVACLHAGLVNIPAVSKKAESRNCFGFISLGGQPDTHVFSATRPRQGTNL